MKQEDSIDLDTLALAEDATQRVGITFDDDGNPKVGFIIVGKDSQQYRDCAARMRAAGIKRGAVKSQRIDTKTDEGALQLDNVMQKNELEMAVAVTVGWFGFTSGGQPAEFSTDTVRKAFQLRPTWREKVSAALENEAGFLPTSATSSASSPASTSA